MSFIHKRVIKLMKTDTNEHELIHPKILTPPNVNLFGISWIVYFHISCYQEFRAGRIKVRTKKIRKNDRAKTVDSLDSSVILNPLNKGGLTRTQCAHLVRNKKRTPVIESPLQWLCKIFWEGFITLIGRYDLTHRTQEQTRCSRDACKLRSINVPGSIGIMILGYIWVQITIALAGSR